MTKDPSLETKAPRPDSGLSYCFVFNCSAGEREIKALLLAASLRRNAQCRFEMVAGVVAPATKHSPAPSQATLRQLRALGVRIEDITNDVHPKYPYANKINCLAVATEMAKVVFLDYDIMCLRAFVPGDCFRAPVSVKPADLPTFTTDLAIWERVYQTCGLELPTERVKATIQGGEMPPYFNSGVVVACPGTELSRTWSDLCRTIDADRRIPNKRPWLEQAALPVALHKLGLKYDLLTEEYNYPAHLKAIDEDHVPILCHYHTPKVIQKERVLRDSFYELVTSYPLIRRRVSEEPIWEELFQECERNGSEQEDSQATPVNAKPARRPAALDAMLDCGARLITRPRDKRQNILVTGIPRSGTSLFSTLLNQLDNAVCLNEVYYGEQLFRLFRKLRREILQGAPIPNKLDAGGKATTNTIQSDTQIGHSKVEIQNKRFVLAHKLTLPYLNRLPELVAQGWQVWAMVRHPAFTISSWKRCPSHFPVVRINPADRLFSDIAFPSEDLEERRIAIWNHYAQLIHDHRENINIIRYEDLIANQEATVQQFCTQYGLEPPTALEPLHSRNTADGYEGLDQAFLDRIQTRCKLSLFDYQDDLQ